jgi:hypothetical protein
MKKFHNISHVRQGDLSLARTFFMVKIIVSSLPDPGYEYAAKTNVHNTEERATHACDEANKNPPVVHFRPLVIEVFAC